MGKSIRISNGKETFEVDSADVQSAAKDGYFPIQRFIVANPKTKESFEIDPADAPAAFKEGFVFSDIPEKKNGGQASSTTAKSVGNGSAPTPSKSSGGKSVEIVPRETLTNGSTQGLSTFYDAVGGQQFPKPRAKTLEEAHAEDKNWAGNLWNRIVTGTEGIMKGASDNVFNAMVSVLPESVVGAKPEEAKKIIRNEVIPQIGGKATEAIKVDVTPQEKKNFDEGFVSGAIGGLAESVPAILAPKGTKVAGLFYQAYDGALNSINATEEGAKLPESTKTIFGVTVGTAQAALEKVGLDKIFGKMSTKVATKLASKTIADLAKKSAVPITAEMVDQAIAASAKSLKDKVVKAGGKIGGAALVEFATGSAQEASTILAETLVNKGSGKQVFEETSFGDKLQRIAKSGAMEAVGGGILGTAAIPFSKTRNYIAEKVSEAKTAEDVAALKSELIAAAPNLSETQVQKIGETIDNYVRVNSKIPETVANRKEVVEKVMEREDIENELEKKQAELEKTDEAFQGEIKQDIEVLTNRAGEINKEIAEAATNPKVEEVTATNEQPNATGDTSLGDKANEPISESKTATEKQGVEEVVLPSSESVGQGDAKVEPSVLNQDKDLKGKDRNALALLTKDEAVSKYGNDLGFKGATERYHKSEVENSISDGFYNKSISEGRMTANDAKKIIESVGLEVPKEILDATKTPTKTEPTQPKQNDTITLPPSIKGGMERKFVFENGEWKQDVGTQKTRVGEPLQKQAQAEFDKVNNKPNEVPVTETESSIAKTEPNKNSQEASKGEATTKEEPKPEPKVSEPEPPKTPPQNPEPIEGEGKEGIGITHAETKKIAEEKGFEGYEKQPETIEEWDAEAEKRIKAGELPQLIKKMERGDEISAVEQRMMGKYIAHLNNQFEKNPTPENLTELRKAIQLSDVVGGRKAGQALVSRKGMFLPDDALSTFLLEKESAQGYPLSEKQMKAESAKFQELKEANEALRKANEKLKEDNDRLIAEQGLNKAKAARNRQSKKSHAEYVAERKDAVQALREALKKSREEASAAIIPGVKELVAVAPHIKKIVESLVNEGIDKLDVVVNDTYALVKDEIDGLTKRDIIDIIAGKHDEKKTKAQINQELRLIKREAELLGQLDAARKGFAKAEKSAKKATTNARIEELKKKIDEVRKLKKAELLQDYEEVTVTQKSLIKKIERLEAQIKNKDFAEEKKAPAPLKLDRNTQILQDRVIELEKKIQHERMKDKLAKRSQGEKIYDFATKEILGVKRILQTLGDFSAWLRQLNRLAFNPRKWDVFKEAVSKSFLATFSQKRFDRYMNAIHKDPQFNEMEKDGVKFNEFSTDEIDKENEFYQKNWLFKVPILKEIPEGSQRGADAALNIARIELYKKYRHNLEKQGITRESDPEVYKWMANEVMNQTGRGKLMKMFENNAMAQKVLGNTFYGARLMASNFNQLNPAYYKSMPKEVRGLIWKDIASYTVTILAVGAIAKAAGASVSLDFDDPDFLQLRFGNKVYDISGGKVQYVRAALRILNSAVAAGKRVSGSISKAEAEAIQKKGAQSTLGFFRNKLAPNTGTVANVVAPQYQYGGREITTEGLTDYYPMYAPDVINAFQNEGLLGIVTTFIPNLVGLGYNEYEKKAKQTQRPTRPKRPERPKRGEIIK